MLFCLCNPTANHLLFYKRSKGRLKNYKGLREVCIYVVNIWESGSTLLLHAGDATETPILALTPQKFSSKTYLCTELLHTQKQYLLLLSLIDFGFMSDNGFRTLDISFWNQQTPHMWLYARYPVENITSIIEKCHDSNFSASEFCYRLAHSSV